MLKIEDFFGLSIDANSSDVYPLLSILGIEKEIKQTKVVKSLIKQVGRNAAIVNIATRQQILKAIHHLLNQEMLPFDPNFYTKEVNTSSAHDRRYNSEEKLLEFAILVSSNKNQKLILNDLTIFTCKQLRESTLPNSRYDKCWELLAKESEHIISSFRRSK